MSYQVSQNTYNGGQYGSVGTSYPNDSSAYTVTQLQPQQQQQRPQASPESYGNSPYGGQRRQGYSRQSGTSAEAQNTHSAQNIAANATTNAAQTLAARYDMSNPIKVLNVLKQLGPPESKEIAHLERVIERDAKHELLYQQQEKHRFRELRKKQVEAEFANQLRQLRQTHPALIFQEGYSGYGNSWTGNKPKLIYPRDRKRSRRISKELVVSREQYEYMANVPELLVPVRLEFEMDKYRLRDTFTWNLNDRSVSVAQFAENLLEDFAIPIHYAGTVANIISEQLGEFHPHAYVDITDPKYASQPDVYRDEDMRITIKLDITVGQHNLVDQFEWDMNCAENCPEEFAELTCAELALPGEFATAIAHSIREQTQLYTKTMFLVGHAFDGQLIEDEEVQREILPPVRPEAFVRTKTAVKEFAPVLYEISEQELDRQDKDRDREGRRKRRQGRAGRRGGPLLPDLHESVRTFRTPVYSQILPGGVDRNLEILRLHIKNLEESDEDDEGRPKRARYAAQLSQGSLLQQQQAKYMSPGRGALRLTEYSRHQSHEPERFIVKLKVPRLKVFLAQQINRRR